MFSRMLQVWTEILFVPCKNHVKEKEKAVACTKHVKTMQMNMKRPCKWKLLRGREEERRLFNR